jgi:hypothetical protein
LSLFLDTEESIENFISYIKKSLDAFRFNLFRQKQFNIHFSGGIFEIRSFSVILFADFKTFWKNIKISWGF